MQRSIALGVARGVTHGVVHICALSGTLHVASDEITGVRGITDCKHALKE